MLLCQWDARWGVRSVRSVAGRRHGRIRAHVTKYYATTVP